MIRNVLDHYSAHLGPIYSWMLGGVESAIARGDAELDAMSLSPRRGSSALDLGAGIGMHAIPLARRGYSVVALDSDAALLDELKQHSKDPLIRTVVADLSKFRDHVSGAVDLILCMGDTLTHLPNEASIRRLFADIACTLSHHGEFICTFRNYATEQPCKTHFVAVKSTCERILTCVLEYGDRMVTVHDILHECADSEWRMRVSSYQKLRLSPCWVRNALDQCGLDVAEQRAPNGMVRLTARLPDRDQMAGYYLSRNQPDNFS
jgi:2-polyprenyl-3-methyl-5-hydroxy-6-metoxy-1,4-benzoquinol methylase